jgi:hypothetical protein
LFDSPSCGEGNRWKKFFMTRVAISNPDDPEFLNKNRKRGKKRKKEKKTVERIETEIAVLSKSPGK